ncbi:hypothetical protein TI39_contig67g00005 [Zymoseptoria brevis]|uniref:F-box domain-containing protein n=1 Tax=Zymoseptoria brevis TaxID=1047168 RepID=A0A0F4H1B5_9PEZI|nr:hypothetical protein TI39_contig67g00005 [Zymoseptoria brevis]
MQSDLPPELIHQIFDDLDSVADIRRLRLVSHMFKEIANEYMKIRHIEAYLRRTDVEMMADITERNPRIAERITSFDFHTGLLLPARDRAHWDEMRRLTILDEAITRCELSGQDIWTRRSRRTLMTKRFIAKSERDRTTVLNREMTRFNETELHVAYDWYRDEVQDQTALLTDGTLQDSMIRLFRACEIY